MMSRSPVVVRVDGGSPADTPGPGSTPDAPPGGCGAAGEDSRMRAGNMGEPRRVGRGSTPRAGRDTARRNTSTRPAGILLDCICDLWGPAACPVCRPEWTRGRELWTNPVR